MMLVRPCIAREHLRDPALAIIRVTYIRADLHELAIGPAEQLQDVGERDGQREDGSVRVDILPTVYHHTSGRRSCRNA